jgi:hypothetical protein
MSASISGADGIQRVDVALLVGDAGYRLGVLHFPLADASPTDESFNTVGAYSPSGGRGLGVTSRLDTHTVSVRLSPAGGGTEVLLDAASLTDAAADGAAWTRTRTIEDAPGLSYELSLDTTPDSARLHLRLLAAPSSGGADGEPALWFSTTVRSTRNDTPNGTGPLWTTTHTWTSHNPFDDD